MSFPFNRNNVVILGALGISLAAFALVTGYEDKTSGEGERTPVLVELFTSESCSSCPPADRLLAQLEKSNSSVIVLSEHVTYWNDIGWKDPYSSRESTDRQSAYVSRLGLSGSYTPQMVVDGRFEFVGSNAVAASRAIQEAAATVPIGITVSDFSTTGNSIRFSIATGKVNEDAKLWVVLAQDEGIEHIPSGENGGRVLRHVQIARMMRQVAIVKRDAAYKGELSVDLPQPIAGSGWHLVAFLQQGSGGPILGVAAHGV